MTHEDDPAFLLMQHAPTSYDAAVFSPDHRPRIGVRDKVYAGMTGGLAVLQRIHGVFKANWYKLPDVFGSDLPMKYRYPDAEASVFPHPSYWLLLSGDSHLRRDALLTPPRPAIAYIRATRAMTKRATPV